MTTAYDYNLSSQNARFAMGKCIYCGKTEPMYNTKYCPDCAEKELKRNMKNYYKDPKKYLERGNNLRRKKRAEAKSKGYCQDCFKRKVKKEGDYYCLECKIRIKKAKYIKNGTSDKRYVWKLEGKCYFCGGEKLKDKKTCQKCYSKLTHNAEKARNNRDLSNSIFAQQNKLIKHKENK